MERIEDWLFSLTIVYIIKKKFMNKAKIIEVANYMHKIGVPDLIIIDKVGSNLELEKANRYFRYFSKYSNICENEIIFNREKYYCQDNIVVIVDNNICYHSRYINKIYLDNVLYDMNEQFQDACVLADVNGDSALNVNPA